jgi:hypothetical protein
MREVSSLPFVATAIQPMQANFVLRRRHYRLGGSAQLTVVALMVSSLTLASGTASGTTRQASLEDLRAGFCIPFIQQRYETASLSAKMNPSEKMKEVHQKYESMFNKLRRFILTRVESFTDDSLKEFRAAMASGQEERSRIDRIKVSCVSEAVKEDGPPNDRILACFKRRNVETTKYEECEKMDFLPY